MIDPTNVPPVGEGELLARFIMSKSQIKSSEGRVKQDAFMPNKHKERWELSVMRHLQATLGEIRIVGEGVASRREPPRTLYGWADIVSDDARNLRLSVDPEPEPDNPNHANILNWPDDKPAQKAIAAELAKLARFVPNP